MTAYTRLSAVFLLTIGLFLPAPPVYALTAPELAARLQESYDKTKDLKADFNQTTVLAAVNSKKEASGTLTIKKPGMMRYVYARPERQEWTIKADDVIIYTPGQNQVINKTLSRGSLDRTPATFLAGLGKITDSFEPRLSGSGEKDGKGRYVLELVPKGKGMGVKDIVLVLDPDNFNILGFTFTETSGNINSFRFSNIKINSGIKESVFNFRIPKGAELIGE